MKSRYGIGYFLVFIITGILFAGLFFGCSPSDKKVDEAGKYVLSALKAKYKKEFAIKKGHYIANTGGYEFTVYPKNDPDFTFNAWLNGMTESGESDGYLLAMQDYEEKQMIEPYIKAISNDYFIDTVAPGPSPKANEYKQMVADMYKYQMSVSDLLNRFPGKIETSIQTHINYNITPVNEDNVLKKVYNLIEFLKEKKFGYINIWILFYNFPNQSIKKLADKNINFGSEYPAKAKYTFSVKSENIKEINDYQGLRKYIREVSKIKLEN